MVSAPPESSGEEDVTSPPVMGSSPLSEEFTLSDPAGEEVSSSGSDSAGVSLVSGVVLPSPSPCEQNIRKSEHSAINSIIPTAAITIILFFIVIFMLLWFCAKLKMCVKRHIFDSGFRIFHADILLYIRLHIAINIQKRVFSTNTFIIILPFFEPLFS